MLFGESLSADKNVLGLDGCFSCAQPSKIASQSKSFELGLLLCWFNQSDRFV
jgi:hypothetical protein